MRIDIVEVLFGISHWLISSVFTELSAPDMIMAGYYCFTFYHDKHVYFFHKECLYSSEPQREHELFS